MDHRTHRTRKRHFAEIDGVRRQDGARERGDQRRRRRKIRRRLAHAKAARHVQIDVMLPELEPSMGLQHRDDHGEPRRIPADHRAPGRAQRRGRHQRLHLHQHGTRALHARENGGAGGRSVAARQEKRGGVGDLGESLPRHFENADLVGGAEAVLHRAQNAEVAPAVPLEGDDRIDHMLDHAGAGDLAVLGHMAHENHRRAAGLGVADQRLRRAAHLGDRAGGGFHRLSPHGLDGIDDDEGGRAALLQGGDDILDAGLGGQLHRRIRQPKPLCAQTHLRHRLFARDIGDPMALAREDGAGLYQERGFADSGLAAQQDHRARHEPTAGHPVQLAHPRDNARGALGLAGQALQRKDAALARPARRLGSDAGAHLLLHDAVPAVAGLALAQPPLGQGAAVLADEVGADLGHVRPREL